MNTADLQGAALDWAVALIEYPEWKEQGFLEAPPHDLSFDDGTAYAPSTNWAQGGPIIERGLIVISPDPQHGWRAMPYMDATKFYGPTPLIAAMRCYVASVLGDEVYVPEEVEA